jgi:two-component sensor histidine kinase
LGESAAVVVSELVTNAVQARCSQVTVELNVHRSLLRVAVDDDAAGWPQVGTAEARDVHGRGLAIVAHVAHGWGAEQLPVGKQVWAELPVAPGLADGLTCHL